MNLSHANYTPEPTADEEKDQENTGDKGQGNGQEKPKKNNGEKYQW